MAIKVSGTTVVDDSRGLTNIATVDATTAAAISAAGVGGGGEHDFVASGAIANGDVVALNSDGTVSIAGFAAATEGTPTVYRSVISYDTSAIYDTGSNKVIAVNRDNGGDANYTVGTVSGTSISFGTSVLVDNDSDRSPVAVYDSVNNKVVAIYGSSNAGPNFVRAAVGTVSGTSISFGTATTIASGTYPNSMKATYDSANGKVVVVYESSANSLYLYVAVGTVSGTSISFSTPAQVTSYRPLNYALNYDSTSGKVILFLDNGSSPYAGICKIGTVSGSSITFSSDQTVTTTQTTYQKTIIPDPNTGKILLAWRDNNSNLLGSVGTLSGTTLTVGTSSTILSGYNVAHITGFYDSNRQECIVAGNKPVFQSGYRYVPVLISGTSFSLGTSADSTDRAIYLSGLFDPDTNNYVFAYNDDGNNGGYGTAQVLDPGQTNAADYIGIAAEAISDTATGAVTIDGGVNEGQSSLTIGTTYYVADDGSLSTTNNGRKIGRAISATKLLVDSAMSGDEMNTYLGSLV